MRGTSLLSRRKHPGYRPIYAKCCTSEIWWRTKTIIFHRRVSLHRPMCEARTDYIISLSLQPNALSSSATSSPRQRVTRELFQAWANSGARQIRWCISLITNTRSSTWEGPHQQAIKNAIVLVSLNSALLPGGWEEKRTLNGQVYLVHRNPRE